MTAQGVLGALDRDPQRTAERRPLADVDQHAGQQADAGEVAQGVRVTVADPFDPDPGAGRSQRQGCRPPIVVRAGSRGDRIPVRVVGRMLQERIDAFFEPVGQAVLEHLGLSVDLVPGDPEYLGKEGLQQPVPPDDPQRRSLAARRQADSAGTVTGHQLPRLQALHHPGDRRRRDAQPAGDGRCRDRALRGGKLIDGLEVVLNCLGSLHEAKY